MYMVIAVASDWSKRKGLNDIIKIAGVLDENYKLVVVGTNNQTDKILPHDVISIHRTQNPTELALLYSAADVLINPTYEENYPTVNLEAIACGTPVVTYNSGGSAEMILEGCGIVVPRGDVDGMLRAIKFCCSHKAEMESACTEAAKKFSQSDRFSEYVDGYCLV